MEWIRTRREERKRKRQAVRQTARRDGQLLSVPDQARAEPTVIKPTQHLLNLAPTRLFSLRCKRGASIGMATYEQLHHVEEPEHSDREMQQAKGEDVLRNPFATPPPAEAASINGLPPTPNPDADDTGGKTWLGQVSGTIHRKSSVIDAYKNGGIRSAWACTLPRNWKTRNTLAGKAITDTTTHLSISQIHRLNDDYVRDGTRSPLPNHWREEFNASQQALVHRTSQITVEDSAMGDWIDPDAMERDDEFEDWTYQHKALVEQYNPFTEAEEHASRISMESKRRYTDY